MLVGLAVGVVISLFQALTQIQEMTMVFVPKILAIFLVVADCVAVHGREAARPSMAADRCPHRRRLGRMRIDISFLPALAAAFLLVFARVGTMVMLLPGLGDMTCRRGCG